jgi:2-oxoglutarate dehydrogenase complex dehydrogenase (E1) component-like enzyme
LAQAARGAHSRRASCGIRAPFPPLDDLAEGKFHRVLADQRPAADAKTSRILLCSGKVYYDLIEFRERQQRDDVAILRVEQFYPLSQEALRTALEPYADGTPACWVQEEPQNMGARAFWNMRFGNRLFDRFPMDYVTRPESASPATVPRRFTRENNSLCWNGRSGKSNVVVRRPSCGTRRLTFERA